LSYTAGFDGTSSDLELAVRRSVARSYKQRANIGQKSKSLAGGAGTESFDWDILPEDMETIMYYKRRAVVP